MTQQTTFLSYNIFLPLSLLSFFVLSFLFLCSLFFLFSPSSFSVLFFLFSPSSLSLFSFLCASSSFSVLFFVLSFLFLCSLEWSTVWHMPFNLDKCHVLHAGTANQEENYSLLGSAITSVDQETDLGVVITADLKSSAQCIAAEQKAQKILGYIKRVFRYRNKQTVLALYRALVRPLLEYGAQFWSPIRRVDVERLEKVQARATKLVPSIRHKGYQRRLADLGLFTLEQRRLRGLLIETFKILRGFSGLDPASVFELSVNRTRNHGYKVVPPRSNTVLYRDFPTVRVCNLWNSLPEAVVNAPSVDAFKGRLDKILPGLAF